MHSHVGRASSGALRMRNCIGFGGVAAHFTYLHSVAREPEMDTSQDYCRYTVLYLNGLLYV